MKNGQWNMRSKLRYFIERNANSIVQYYGPRFFVEGTSNGAQHHIGIYSGF